MSSVRVSFYDAQTGAVSRKQIECPEHLIARNTPAGLVAFVGNLDPHSQRVDVSTGQPVDWQPPAPDDEHEFVATNPGGVDRAAQRWRYVKRSDVVEREQRRAAALARIELIEGQSLRTMRELLLAIAPDGPAKTRLQQRDDEIGSQREDL